MYEYLNKLTSMRSLICVELEESVISSKSLGLIISGMNTEVIPRDFNNSTNSGKKHLFLHWIHKKNVLIRVYIIKSF